ncbi:MAG: serine--tRNA ligase [Gemmatimonadota bacterium]|nr:serine--tRNA ligase [Gemmatimonadota bacterium]
MLELKYIRNNAEGVARALEAKQVEPDLDSLLALDKERRSLLAEVESLKARRNKANQQIKNAGGKPDPAVITEMKELSGRIKEMDARLGELGPEIEGLLLAVPNLPHESVPVGTSEKDNVVIKSWGEKKEFSYQPLPHWEIGENLGLLDSSRAAKLSGSGFILFTGMGALLERALINYMLEMHITSHGYTEVSPPFIVSRDCMTGTGQLPKMEDDMYRVEADDLFLIPTAEVPVTNLLREEIIEAGRLPIYYTAYTPCFRREAGSYGKDTRGLIRVHQFDKVEMVKFVRPETSYEELESLLQNAEDVLQSLGLHYRVLELCSADLSFASAKCYDIEVWAPGVGKYLEVSSCSNFEDFQARRSGIRFRGGGGVGGTEFVHTLNGSGLALPRTVIALLETYQNPDGSVTIPEPLRPFMRGMEKIG